ncbi:TraB/GumN family protein [Nitratireductor pacificus]|uniref:GumN family protein n=1 Tax=Nitratireductor pacificus pht-3B TaxID=391937 RepID=K2MDV9_9HYPH|nr:TraB/GumN family protein [Nitratireductor pacificus]EKF18960.1 GumN family protein [Nitratireductor pacificus pht-3B]
MKIKVSTFERNTDLALLVVAALPMLLLMALLAGLLAATPVAARDIACTGQSLLTELAAENPDLLREVRRKAAETPNGKGLLWRVEKDGVAPSYLFGTMHMSDPRIVDLPDAAQVAFDAAERVVIETTDILDQKAMAAAMFQRPDLTMFTGDETLADHLSQDDRTVVENALAERGVPFASVRKMKPWMLIALVALPACEVARKDAGLSVLDVKLAQEAQANGKELLGLESAVEQLSAMASLPMEMHARGLVETLALGDRLDDVMETMVALYLEGETGMFWPLIRAAFPDQDAGEADYAAFDQAMVRARNGVMAERAMPILERGNAFIAVGALHLPGAEGLVERLRRAGYSVESAG